MAPPGNGYCGGLRNRARNPGPVLDSGIEIRLPVRL